MDDSARLRAEVGRRAASREAARTIPTSKDAITSAVLQLAAKHGVDPSKLRPATDAEMAAKDAEIHAARVARQADILLSRLPAMYRDAVLPDTEWARQALVWLAEFRSAFLSGSVPPPSFTSRKSVRAGSPPPSLTIMGPPGSGKTWVACALARMILTEDTIPVTFTTVETMLDSLRPAQGGLDVDLIQYAVTPLLVLDDLGAEKLTEWGETQLYRIAHERNHNGRPCIITSNLDGPGVRGRYNERLVERLFAGSRLIVMPGQSRRPMPF